MKKKKIGTLIFTAILLISVLSAVLVAPASGTDNSGVSDSFFNTKSDDVIYSKPSVGDITKDGAYKND